mgnify:CR=1 FL=1
MEHNPIHNDDCIYTPDVVVIKTDIAKPILMPENEWYKVNMITCAAPNLREKPSNMMNSGDGDERVEIKYIHAFRVIEFAVYCSPRDSHNYDVFSSVLRNMQLRHKR